MVSVRRELVNSSR